MQRPWLQKRGLQTGKQQEVIPVDEGDHERVTSLRQVPGEHRGWAYPNAPYWSQLRRCATRFPQEQRHNGTDTA